MAAVRGVVMDRIGGVQREDLPETLLTLSKKIHESVSPGSQVSNAKVGRQRSQMEKDPTSSSLHILSSLKGNPKRFRYQLNGKIKNRQGSLVSAVHFSCYGGKRKNQTDPKVLGRNEGARSTGIPMGRKKWE